MRVGLHRKSVRNSADAVSRGCLQQPPQFRVRCTPAIQIINLSNSQMTLLSQPKAQPSLSLHAYPVAKSGQMTEGASPLDDTRNCHN